jgi:hypothetical protein
MNVTMKYIAAFIIILLLPGCPFDVYKIDPIPVSLEAHSEPLSDFELTGTVVLDIGYGYERSLRAGCRWTPVGTIAYGNVCKTEDQILTVEASSIYEAFIVISGNELVGFYLPVEDAYYAVDEKQPLSMKTLKPKP